MEMTKTGKDTLWQDDVDVEITENDIHKRIISYKKQDEKAGREIKEDEMLTVEQVQSLLENPVCHICHRLVSWANWSLDRKENTKTHTLSNVRVASHY